MSQQNQPRRIRKLSDKVIAQIAAGEVIQRPVNALKELIENSLDAGATSIQIVVAGGGFKLIQITDNGHGICREDLDILCCRHSTSKLQTYEDLESIETFGFRGEALASMTHCAYVTVVSKTESQECAYRAEYLDSKLKPGTTIKPCAGNTGTQIKLEELFYNNRTRRNALSNEREEFKRITELVQKYAINNPGVSFTLKKKNEPRATLHTQSTATIKDNIRQFYLRDVYKNLIEFDHSCDNLDFKVHGYFTGPNYSSKKSTFILFVNKRLVTCRDIKKGIESTIEPFLPKGTHPFVYMHLQVNPARVDVNVHPTKKEVRILNQDNIIEEIQKIVNQKLLSVNSSRVMNVLSAQSLPSIRASSMKVAAYDKVHTTGDENSMDLYVKKKRSNEDDFLDVSPPKKQKLEENEVNLTSVRELRQEFKDAGHKELTDIIRHHTYVGWINPSLSLIQYGTKLYLVKVPPLSIALMYQLVLNKFQKFKILKFSEGADIYKLVCECLKFSKKSDEEIDAEAKAVVDILHEKAEMIFDYFKIEIKDGKLLALPELLPGHRPSLHRLPEFLYRLATRVDWEEEKSCFQTIASEMAIFYSINREWEEDNMDQLKYLTQHIIFPACKMILYPSQEFATDGTFVQVTCVSKLYKVFERC